MKTFKNMKSKPTAEALSIFYQVMNFGYPVHFTLPLVTLVLIFHKAANTKQIIHYNWSV